MSEVNHLKSLNLSTEKYAYYAFKNWGSKNTQTDFKVALPVTSQEQALKICKWMAELLTPVLNQNPLINIKGRSTDERLFFLEGETKKAEEDTHLDSSFFIEFKSEYAGKVSSKAYAQKISRLQGGQLPAGTSAMTAIEQSQKIISCQLHLEFMTESFFYRLGAAPVVQESLSVWYDNNTDTFNVHAQSNAAKTPTDSPLNQIEWWEKVQRFLNSDFI